MEVVRAEHGGDVGSGLRRHGLTEDLRLGRVGLQVRPEPLGRHLLQRRGTGAQRMLQVAEGGREQWQSHHLGEGAHRLRMIATQQPGRLGVLIGSANIGEDAVGGQQPQDPVKCLRVGTASRCKLGDVDRVGSDVIGHPELGYDMNTAGDDYGVGQGPDDLVRLLRHFRSSLVRPHIVRCRR